MQVFGFDKLNTMKYLTLFFVSSLVISARADVVEFKNKPEDASCKGTAQVSVSEETDKVKKILYKIDIPLNGSAQVHLLTGNFQIDASTKEGCEYQNLLQISELPNKAIDIALTKQSRAIASLANPKHIGNDYPYSGSIRMDKPNIYLTGKEKGSFKLKIKGNDFNFLSTVPSFNNGELSGELRDGRIYSDNAGYSYISYDARVGEQEFQNTHGFCGTRKEIYMFMMEGFTMMEFPETAKNDFATTSSAKLPEADRYCVYPQVSAQLDKIAPIDFSYSDKSEVHRERLFYLIIPQTPKNQRSAANESRFSGKPKSNWRHRPSTVYPKSAYLYEWGLGFMFE